MKNIRLAARCVWTVCVWLGLAVSAAPAVTSAPPACTPAMGVAVAVAACAALSVNGQAGPVLSAALAADAACDPADCDPAACPPGCVPVCGPQDGTCNPKACDAAAAAGTAQPSGSTAILVAPRAGAGR